MKFDLLDPATFSDGHPVAVYRWLRDNAPVYRHAEPDGAGFSAVTRFDDVKAIGRNHETFSSSPTIMIADPKLHETAGDHQMMLMMDPPRHTAYRRLLSWDFTPRAVSRLTSRVDTLATRIVDAIIERGECDLVTDIAGELPSYVVADLLGLPLDDGRKLYELTETVHSAPTAVPPGAQQRALADLFGYAAGLVKEKRPHASTGDDLSCLLLRSEVEGKPLDDMDFALFFILLVDAGGDTTRNLVAGGMQALFDHPDQRRHLQADLDARLPGAIEEMLRYVSPVVYMRRTATCDTVINSTEIARGDKVVMYYGAADRDDAVFADGDAFDIARSPNPHIAFGGGGAHYCLGAHLARVEISALLRELLTRIPDIEPTAPAEWLPSTFISGPKHLPVRWAPAP